MTRIRRLPDHLVNKIAAGEVVERPGSVVKELVENALDADSRTITVELKDAGRQLIRVADDGTGMTAEEVDLALLRHATSKLAVDADDLQDIATLGFRGEALPAICAVTRFSVRSCPRGADTGTLVRGEGGVVVEKILVEAQPGTVVEAGDLFFNTPGRLKFLKAAATELAVCLRLLHAVALAHPVVHLRVFHNGKAVLTAPRARTLRDRLGALRGFDRVERMLDVDRTGGGVAVSGLVAPPQSSRGNRDDITLIVNGRPVRDTLLAQSVIDAYRPLLARDQFPVAVLRIDVPGPEVDVNVHPTKAWVRFRSPRAVQEALFAAVQDALRSSRVVQAQPGLRPGETSTSHPSGGWESPGGQGNAGTSGVEVTQRDESGFADTGAVAAAGLDWATGSQPALFRETVQPFGPARFGEVVGQLQETFIVAATDDEVFFIDQHVAHERVLFERLERDLSERPLASQELLFPHPLELGPGQPALLGEWATDLTALGFSVEGFGGSAVLLRAVPSLLKGQEPQRLIEALVGEVGAPAPRAQTAPVLHRALAFVACRAAIKAHERLEHDQMSRLLRDLSDTRTPYFCPHGRPIVSRLSLREIKRELGRTW